MPELPDRFRVLDQLEVPDIDARARALGPRPPTEPDGPSRKKRVTAIVVALVIAVAGVGLLVRAFRQDDSSAPAAEPPSELIAMAVGYGSTHQVGSTWRFTDIAVARPDGTGVRHVTGSAADLDADPWVAKYGFSSDDSPAFSPDGRTIAFVRRYSEGTDSLCTIGVDGSGFRVVVRDLGGAELAWSPDGTRFAYYSERDGGVHVIDADGSNDHPVAPRKDGQPNQDTPSWTPDSKDLYFVSGTKVFEVAADGTGLRVVMSSDQPIIAVTASPDGATLAVVRNTTHPDDQSVWLVGPDGSHLRRLTPSGVGDAYGFGAVTWSPDGSRLLMSGPGEHLWLIDADGRNFRRFPEIPHAGAPTAWWGPSAPTS
jgi:WD40-like Beta Propeller Repeat